MSKPPYAPLLTNQSDLEAAWRHLMRPRTFGGRSVWMMCIVADRPLPQLLEIAESDTVPTPEQAEGFIDLLAILHADQGPDLRFAFLFSRPGPARVTGEDRAWARFLTHSCRTAEVPVDVVHVATTHGIFPVAPDDLLASA